MWLLRFQFIIKNQHSPIVSTGSLHRGAGFSPAAGDVAPPI